MDESFYRRHEKRPPAFTVLLVLTTIASLWNVLTSAFLLSYTANLPEGRKELEDQIIMSAEQSGVMQLDEQFQNLISRYLDHSPLLPLLGVIIGFFTLLGASLMFKQHKAGFHIYTISRILDTFLPAVMAGPEFFSFFALLTNGCFVFFYSTYLRYMDR
jgi:hypothetical protein